MLYDNYVVIHFQTYFIAEKFSKMIRSLIYLMIFSIWVYAVYFDVVHVHFPHFPDVSWFSKLKFLTTINMVLKNRMLFIHMFETRWIKFLMPIFVNSKSSLLLHRKTFQQIVETVYFGTCLLRSLIDTWHESPKKGPHRQHPAMPTYYPSTKLHVVCDNLYALLAFPLGLVGITVVYGIFS